MSWKKVLAKAWKAFVYAALGAVAASVQAGETDVRQLGAGAAAAGVAAVIAGGQNYFKHR
jgi:hypothetical protein